MPLRHDRAATGTREPHDRREPADDTSVAPSDKTLLIAEDDPSIRRLLTTILGMDYVVHEAENGQAALDALAGGLKVDAFILDVMMPGLDGFDLACHVRAMPGHADTPIVMLTALAEAEHRARAKAVGADAFLNKPFDPEMLLATLSLHLLGARV